MGLCWIDNSTVATCSLDCSVKIWNITEGIIKYTLYPEDKNALDIPNSACGINCNSNHLILLTLNGMLHFWVLANLSDEKLPDISIDGHQNYVSSIIKTKSGSIISGDFNGKIIIWNDDKYSKTINNHTKKIVSLDLSPSQDLLYSIDVDGNICSFNFNESITT